MAYRRRRFRKNRGIWLPVLGREPEAVRSTTMGRTSIALTDDDWLDGITGVVPVTLDTPRQRGDVTQAASMGDILTNEYFLERIVGDIYVSHDRQSPQYNPTAWDVNQLRSPIITWIGFVIARADDNNPDTPLGVLTDDGKNFQVDGPDNARQPWIWRRSWVTQPGWLEDYIQWGVRTTQAPDIAPTWPKYPQNNFSAGQGLYNGPRIDQKTKRRVRQEDRLWMVVTCRSYPPSTAAPNQDAFAEIDINWDLRLYGGLRKARNNGQYT